MYTHSTIHGHICWPRQYHEMISHDIVGALVTWAIYTQGQLLLWSSLILSCGVHRAYSQVGIGYDYDNEGSRFGSRLYMEHPSGGVRLWVGPQKQPSHQRVTCRFEHPGTRAQTRKTLRAGVSLRRDFCYDSWSLSHLGWWWLLLLL